MSHHVTMPIKVANQKTETGNGDVVESVNIFKRTELKYLLTEEQNAAIHKIIRGHLPQDGFGEYLVQSIYFDTPNWDVIRASIEKPRYKEKLRLRCYGVPGADSSVYLELKKKYNGVVYKRRIASPITDLHSKSPKEIAGESNSQTGRELSFYLNSNPVSEKAHISYTRTAFAGAHGLRITFDTDLRFRADLLDYQHPQGGQAVLPEDMTVMEVKATGGMPLWLAQALSELKIFATTFSKYGAGYKKYILQ